jgi:hypothetical protein
MTEAAPAHAAQRAQPAARPLDIAPGHASTLHEPTLDDVFLSLTGTTGANS